MDGALSDIGIMHKTFEEKEVVRALIKRVDDFTALEHVDWLQNHLLPKIDRFSELIDSLKADNQHMRQCIRKFDQSISIKANKSQFRVQKEELERNFIHIKKWESVLAELDAIKHELREDSRRLDIKFDKFAEHEIQNNDIKCEELMKHKLK